MRTTETTGLFGFTRDIVKRHYALLTPGGLVATHLPGWEKAVCHVLISPALGAGFSQLLITLEREGKCVGNTGANQYFVYVLEGAASILLEARKHRLETGGYAYLPSGQDVQIAGGAAATRLLVFQKEYQPLPGVPRPAGFAGHEREVKAHPFRGDPDLRLQVLLPSEPAFDMAVNVLACPPGAALPVVEAPLFGQDWNDDAWAVCKSDMLIKGEDADNIILGDTFTLDGFKKEKYDYMLANPPFGVEWKQQQRYIEQERDSLGYQGRFGAGLPRVNDGALLFLQHMLSKMRAPQDGGSRLPAYRPVSSP